MPLLSDRRWFSHRPTRGRLQASCRPFGTAGPLSVPCRERSRPVWVAWVVLWDRFKSRLHRVAPFATSRRSFAVAQTVHRISSGAPLISNSSCVVALRAALPGKSCVGSTSSGGTPHTAPIRVMSRNSRAASFPSNANERLVVVIGTTRTSGRRSHKISPGPVPRRLCH